MTPTYIACAVAAAVVLVGLAALLVWINRGPRAPDDDPEERLWWQAIK